MSALTFAVGLWQADKLLSPEFQVVIEELIGFMHPERQIMLYSATFPVAVRQFKDKFLNKPHIINLMEELTLKGITQASTTLHHRPCANPVTTDSIGPSNFANEAWRSYSSPRTGASAKRPPCWLVHTSHCRPTWPKLSAIFLQAHRKRRSRLPQPGLSLVWTRAERNDVQLCSITPLWRRSRRCTA